MRKLNLCVDMYGCPNRCKHCWLGKFPHSEMEIGADEYIVNFFKPYFDKIEFYSWMREPDFSNDYADIWERDKRLSVSCEPERFELASFYRLVRDEKYVTFLKNAGVKTVQLTFFGMEELTDKYVGRKGAFYELSRAADILIDNGITPRYQVFINNENKDEILDVLRFLKEKHSKKKCCEKGIEFKFFIHEGSCDGENRKLYDIRISKADIPEELRQYHLDYDSLLTERECCERLRDDTSSFVYHNEDDITLYVTSSYDVYYNFTNISDEWKIGNIKEEPPSELIKRIISEDTPALNAARRVTLSRLVELFGDFSSERAFYLDDYKAYLLNEYISQTIR